MPTQDRERIKPFPDPEKGEAKPKNGGVAQLGEHLPCKQGVMGSNPIISTKVTDEEDGYVTNKSKDSKGNRYRANFRWTFATEEDRARSSRETESHHLHQPRSGNNVQV